MKDVQDLPATAARRNDRVDRVTVENRADAIAVTRPSFGMYAVCARIQGARVLERVPA